MAPIREYPYSFDIIRNDGKSDIRLMEHAIKIDRLNNLKKLKISAEQMNSRRRRIKYAINIRA
jgi:hypothetical protein